MDVDAPPPHRNGTVPVITSHKQSRARTTKDSRPTVEDLQGDNWFAERARDVWLKGSKPPKVRKEVVEEFWGQLEKEGFTYGSLLLLETLQILERYLWPGYSDDASNSHVLLLALITNVKRREDLPSWSLFESKPAEFSSLFRRLLSMTVDTALPTKLRTHLICFVIGAFESLDSGLVRKECAPLLSISIWHNLHSDAAREEKFNNHVMLRKAWRATGKKYDTADDAVKARLRFERSWLYTLLLDFLNRIYEFGSGETAQANLHYCERFLEFLVDLEAQLPTRRYVNSLLQNLNIIPGIVLSPMYQNEDNGLFRDLFTLFKHFVRFPIDDNVGQQLSPIQYNEEHCARLAKLQRVSFKHFQEKLKVLTLSNFGSLGQRADLQSHLQTLSDEELVELCDLLHFRTVYPQSSKLVRDRGFWLEVLISSLESQPIFQEDVKQLAVVPTDKTLYEDTFARNESYNGSRPLAIPKLNLQYLTMGDFLWRSFILHRCEAFYAIRKDTEDAIKRMQPRTQAGQTRFNGQSRMALPIPKPAIVDVSPANVGDFHPAKVRAEVLLDVQRLALGVRREWDSLRPGDVVFLAAVRPLEEKSGITNGHSDPSPAEQIGLRHLRAAEVEQVLDENSKPLRETRTRGEDGEYRRPRSRRLILKIDPVAFEDDRQQLQRGKPDVYSSINLLIRRRGRENNFKPILESIKQLTLSDVPTPSWFQEVFLGYGDPTAATYKRLSNRLKSLDYRDTFLDWQHLTESFPGKRLEPNADANASFGPPHVLEFAGTEVTAPETRPSKKRRRGEEVDNITAGEESIKVSTYKSENTGPYPMDAPKMNTVRFTPAQVEAISSGIQPGLTVIVGPPGTGKTDVATQVINNIYHNFPNQRTLLIAHSNQALNQLFQKIVALDIDERHLLRLGHGEEDLETDASYSKYGRVDSFLERGSMYLHEVTRLAANLQAPGAHGSSCETAGYFNSVYVKPTWTSYWDSVQERDVATEKVIEAFPFHQYFSNAPQPLFPPECTREDALEIVQGCHRHIEKIFAELEDIRPFEILRNARDKANYLLIKEAKIIAMTATHAAMRRREIADLGFHYDNVVMEEAAQVTEMETFIPLALQKPKDGQLPLQRIVLCGDHLQNSPIIQNLAFRQYAKLGQSLFLRLIRLGVPAITLDAQGRARPSIAELYQWRYPTLRSLPAVETATEFLTANAGFKYDYQFVDVPDYKGKGETEPTPHFIQNLGEAETAVAMFMYMRLLGYPAEKISILAMYAGQRALIKDVLQHRCKGNRLFGLPRVVSTVDKYQGEQNDYIILSMTRTLRPGYIRDLRRLTVALSRARLGLYVLGRKSVFESCFELRDAFALLFARPTALRLVKGEYHRTSRLLGDASVGSMGENEVELVGVEALGKYVFEMTQRRIEEIKSGARPLVVPASNELTVDGEEGDEGEEADSDVEIEEV